MDKEKVIEKIARNCGELCEDYAQLTCSLQDCEHCCVVSYTAENIYDCIVKPEIDEVRKETAKEIITKMRNYTFHKGWLTYDYDKLIRDLTQEYGVEVDDE